MKINWISKYAILIILILCVVSRMPQLFSENLILDGDECIVGLMSKHFQELKEMPFFFYGQSYGFSFIEVLAIRLFYVFFGVSEIALKLAMLSLWTVGIIFFYKTLQEIGFKKNPWIPLLITLVFIFSPAFAVWSMKARGGYLSAFALTPIVTYLIISEKWRAKLFVSFIVGFLTVVIYQSQPLWIAGLLPIVAFQLVKNRSFRAVWVMLFGILTGTGVFYFLKIGLPTFWAPSILGAPSFSLEIFDSIIQRMYIHFTGNYFYSYVKDSIWVTHILAVFMMAVIFISLATSIFFLIKRKQINPLFYVLTLSVVFTIGYLFLIKSGDYRYLLPLTGFALMLAALVLSQINYSKAVNSMLLIWISFGTYSLYDFKNYSFEDKSALTSVVSELEAKKITHVFCEGGSLQWQLMFYSKEKVIARYYSSTDRYPAYIQEVNSAFLNKNRHTALVGYFHEFNSPSPNYKLIKNYYYIYHPAEKDVVLERGFDLSKP